MSRLQEVDALRAFALTGIALANYPILAQSADKLLTAHAGSSQLIVTGLLEMFVSGKFFVLFSFLFGWGMGVQIASAERRGIAARGPFLRRLAGLAVLGLLHALLVFHGDILLLYAALGLLLWWLRDAAPRTLAWLALAGVALAIPAYFVMGYGLAEGQATLPGTPQGAGYLGSFAEAMTQRFRDWPPSFLFVLLFNGPLALAAFCAGLGAFKSGLFEPGNPLWLRLRGALPWLLALGLVSNLIHTLAFGAILDGSSSGWPVAAGFTLLAIGSPTLGLVYLWAVVEAARRWGVPQWMAAAGSMSASVYVGQGILGGLIYNGYGGGYYNSLSSAAIATTALGATAVLFAAAAVWNRSLGQGPLERLLRAVTHWR